MFRDNLGIGEARPGSIPLQRWAAGGGNGILALGFPVDNELLSEREIESHRAVALQLLIVGDVMDALQVIDTSVLAPDDVGIIHDDDVDGGDGNSRRRRWR